MIMGHGVNVRLNFGASTGALLQRYFKLHIARHAQLLKVTMLWLCRKFDLSEVLDSRSGDPAIVELTGLYIDLQ